MTMNQVYISCLLAVTGITHSQDIPTFGLTVCDGCSVYGSLTTYPAQKVEIYHHSFQAVYTGALHPS